jgi:hypothetical protein
MVNTFLLFNHKYIFNAIQWIVTYKKLLGKDPSINEIEERLKFKLLSIWSLNVLLTFVWLSLGLLTNEWAIFLSLLLFNLVCNKLFMDIKYSEIKRKLLFSKSLIIVFVIGFLVTKYLFSVIPS